MHNCKDSGTQTESDLPTAEVARYGYAPIPFPPTPFEEAVRIAVPLEAKQFTGRLDFLLSSTAHLIDRLSIPPLGDTAISRIGNQIVPLSFDATVNMHGAIDSPSPVSECRVVVVQWLVDQSANPLLANSIINFTHPLVPYRYDQQDKFKVLFDRAFCLVNDSSSSEFCRVIRISLDLTECLPVYFDNNVFKKNQLFLLAYNNAVASPQGGRITGGTQMLFADA